LPILSHPLLHNFHSFIDKVQLRENNLLLV
jgi:hypothetical protein